MQKLRFFFIILLFPFSLFAQQQRTKIIVQGFEKGRVEPKSNISYLRKPIFRQDNAILTCDSAVFYESKNIFEAFNNVHINQADTVNIYSDHLHYDGNTKVAHLTENVRLLDRESVLTTNVLDYNMGTKIGTYVSGGKIVNKDVTLTSKNGYYFANSRDAYFRYNVVAVTPETTIKSDTLRYNTLTNWTYFYGPTNIKGKDDNLYTENGAYNTKSEYAYFGKKNLYTQGSKSLKGDSLYYDGKAGYGKAVRNIVFRDTIDRTSMYGQLGYYYKKDQRTVVTRNAYIGLGTSDSIKVKDVSLPDSLWLGADTLETQMVLRQTLKLIPLPVLKKDNEVGEEKPSKAPGPNSANKTGIPGKQGKKTVAPAKPVVKFRKGKPIIDTIPIKIIQIPFNLGLVKKDSITKHTVPKANAKKTAGGKPVLKTDSIKKALKDTLVLNPLDTVQARIIKAYHDVRVFKSNVQARADSLFYTSADSTLRWYQNPILWSEGSQQTGDTLYLHLKDKKLNSVQAFNNAFAINVYKDSVRYNQIKGKLMTGFFTNGKLSSMYVDGNAESIYFTKTDKGKYDKMNQTISSRVKILFKDNAISDIVAIKDAEGKTLAIEEVKADSAVLTGFAWKPKLRPLSKSEVINRKTKTKLQTTPSKKDSLSNSKDNKTTTGLQGAVKSLSEIKPADIPKILKGKADSLGVKIDSLGMKRDTTLRPAPVKKQ